MGQLLMIVQTDYSSAVLEQNAVIEIRMGLKVTQDGPVAVQSILFHPFSSVALSLP